MTDGLQLNLPSQTESKDPTLALSLRAQAAWLAELPLADVASATRLVFQAVTGTNRARVSGDLRYQLLERYRPVVVQIAAALSAHFATLPHPLGEANLKIVASLIKLHRELAIGYEIVVTEAGGDAGRRLLAAGLTGAFETLRDCLLVALRGYHLPPPGLWLEMHELYRYGELRGVTAQQDQVPEVERAYLEALLLELADPHCLSPENLETVARCIQAYANAARLVVPNPTDNSPATHLVVYAADAGPVDVADYRLDSPADGRLLKVQWVAKAFHDMLTSLEQGKNTQLPDNLRDRLTSTSVPLLRKVIGAFATRAQRRHNRTYKAVKLEVVRGLAATARRLRVGGDQPLTADDNIAMVGDAHAGVNLAAATVTGADEWQQVNFSPDGVALLYYRGDNHRVRVGDMLGISGLAGAADWRPGVIRRLRYHNGQLTVGVQLLGALTVAARVTERSAAGNRFRDALFLPEDPANGKGPLLVVPTGTTRQKRLTLESTDGSGEFVVGTVVEASEFFELVEISDSQL